MRDPWANQGEVKQASSGGMSFYEKLINVILHPKDFFEFLAKEHSVKDATKYFLLLSYIVFGVLFIYGVVIIFFFDSLLSFLDPFAGFITSLASIILLVIVFGFFAVFPLISLLLNYVYAGVMHIFVMLFRGRGYSKTFSILIYASTPALVTGIIAPIPFVGQGLFGLASLWSLVLMFYGVMKVHEFSFLRTLFMILVIILLLVIVIGLAVFSVIAALF